MLGEYFVMKAIVPSGTCDYPAAKDVKNGVSFNSGTQTGTFVGKIGVVVDSPAVTVTVENL